MVSSQRFHGLLDSGCVHFFFLGVLNNSPYVILLAGSPEIAMNAIGLVYFCAVAPAIVLKFSSQFWFGQVSYAHRMAACAVLMLCCFLMVAHGRGLSMSLLGVMCSSLQTALGEASCLALTSRFPSSERHVLLTGWSSGTGIAGIVGYAWVSVFLHLLGASFRAMLWSALLTLPVAWLFVYFRKIHGRFEDVVQEAPAGVAAAVGVIEDQETLGQRMRGLLPYSLPLFLVYFAEYACQSGIWITIGFPPESEAARKAFYGWSNTMYQVGVFLSRTSGALYELSLGQLPWLAAFQSGLLFFFIAVSFFRILYGWWLLAPAFATGVFGGLCYVNAFKLLSRDSHPSVRERNLALTSTADSFGVACADLVGITLQRWLAPGQWGQ
jgi:battenin